jgi:hypothetical protein
LSLLGKAPSIAPTRQWGGSATSNRPFQMEQARDSPNASASLGSLHLDACRLDDRPPFFSFGLVESPECLRSLLVTRWYVLAEIGEPLAYPRIGAGYLVSGVARRARNGGITRTVLPMPTGRAALAEREAALRARNSRGSGWTVTFVASRGSGVVRWVA